MFLLASAFCRASRDKIYVRGKERKKLGKIPEAGKCIVWHNKAEQEEEIGVKL